MKDLQQEIEKNLRQLQKQAERAERARTLKDKIRKNDLVVHAHEVFEHLKAIRDAKNFINEQTIQIENWSTRKNTLEVDLEEERIKKAELTEQIESLQGEYNQLSKELAGAEEKLNYLCKTLTEKETALENKKKESGELAEEKAERLERLEAQQESYEALKLQGEEGFDFSDLEERVDNLKEQLEDKKSSLSDLTTELDEKRNLLNEVDQEIFRNNSKLEEYASSLEDITTEIETLENQYSGVNNQIASERDEVNNLEKKISELSEQEITLKSKLEDSKSKVYAKEKELKEKTSESIKVESKLSSLIELNNSLEGVKEGVGAFLKEDDHGKRFMLLGAAVRCDEKYTRAVQNVLSEYLDSIVSDDEGIQTITEWFAKNKEHSLDVLNISNSPATSSETIERLKLKFNNQEVLPLEEVVSFDESLGNCKALLNGHYIVEDLTAAQIAELDSNINFKSLVSLNGNYILKNQGAGKLISLRSESESDGGVVTRNNKIEELTGIHAELVKNCEAMEHDLQQLEEALQATSLEYETLRDGLSEMKTDYAAKKSALESKLANFETNSARLDILQNRKKEISKSRFDLLENEEGIAERKSDLKDRVDTLQAETESLKESIEDLNAQYQDNKEELVEKKVQAQSFEERVGQAESLVSDINSQIERIEARITGNIEQIDTLTEELSKTEEEIKSVEEGNNQKATELEDRLEVLDAIKDKFSILLQAMQERENEVKELGKNISKTEKDLVQHEVNYGRHQGEEEQIVRNIFEKYRVDLRSTLAAFLEYSEEEKEQLIDISSIFSMETEEGIKEIEVEPYEFNRRYGQDLKDCSHRLKQYKIEYSRLGEINWQAVEDYERQKLRFDFLKVQEQELAQSLEDLEKAIEHIDSKSRERFKHAFNEVNMRFEKVFPIIFGGGNAQLKLVGNIDDPECGVDIIAQPPGKKMQNINLMSGGEKAMTAVSLIFSIFLVKPSPFCLLDEVDAPLDDANVGRFNELLREMSSESQFILITHNKKTMELNDTLYGVTMQEPGVSKAVSVQLH